MTWREKAACVGEDPELFFLDNRPHGCNQQKDWGDALEVCRWCPVSTECLQEGIDIPWGVWGGTTPGEREQIRGYPYKNTVVRHPGGNVKACSDTELAIRDAYESGLGLKKVAQLLGCSYTFTQKTVKRLGITRAPDRPQKIVTEDDVSKVITMYKTGASVRRTSQHTGVSRRNIEAIVQQAGIARDPKNTKTVRILELHEKGCEPQQIADTLGCTYTWTAEVIRKHKRRA